MQNKNLLEFLKKTFSKPQQLVDKILRETIFNIYFTFPYVINLSIFIFTPRREQPLAPNTATSVCYTFSWHTHVPKSEKLGVRGLWPKHFNTKPQILGQTTPKPSSRFRSDTTNLREIISALKIK